MSGEGDVVVDPAGLGGDPAPRRTGPLALAAVVAAAGVAAFVVGRHVRDTANVTASHAWLTAGLEGPHIEDVQAGIGHVYLHVQIDGATPGTRLRLDCDWFDPDGVTAGHNDYRTRVIDREPWVTHCRHGFGDDAARGTWRVRMTLGGRQLAETVFSVR